MFELRSWTYCRDNSAFELGKGAFVAPWILHNASTYKWGTLGHIEVLHSGRCTTRSTSVLLRSTRSVPETVILFVAGVPSNSMDFGTKRTLDRVGVV